MIRRFFYILLLLFLLPAASAWGTTYYVRADGTVTYANRAGATNPASADSSMNGTTWDDGVYSPGDRIQFSDQGGSYTSGSMTPLSSGNANTEAGRIHLEAVPGETPVFADEGTSRTFNINGLSYVTIKGLSFAPNNAGAGYEAIQFRTSNSSYITIQDCSFNFLNQSGTPNQGINANTDIAVTNLIIDGCTFAGIKNNSIYLVYAGNENITISDTTIAAGSTSEYSALKNVAGVTLENVTFSGDGAEAYCFTLETISGLLEISGLTLSETNPFQVTDSTLDAGSYLEATATNALNSSVQVTGTTSNLAIRNGTYTGGGIAVNLNGCSAITVTSNVISGAVAGFRLKDVTDSTVSANEIKNCTGNAGLIYGDTIGCTITRNYIHDNGTDSVQEGGIAQHETGYNNTISYNTFANNIGYALSNHDTSAGTVSNNYFYRNAWLPGALQACYFSDVTAVNGTSGTSWVLRENRFIQGKLVDVHLSAAAAAIIDSDYNHFLAFDPATMAIVDGSTPISWATYSAREPHSIYGGGGVGMMGF
ncbi:MAG: right-handed parallel beta-helix repeat-containing protein [Desulfuromonadaceae bacterium]|nr:right-handed parallel beta-helix repeat-containing protein [Desulfuromonadaceae bacterium]